MTRVGIMQGRLLAPVDGEIQAFPIDRWETEFEHAAAAGLCSIEWIDDLAGDGSNPLATDDGVAHILELTAQTGVEVNSVCADYFQAMPLVQGSAAERRARRERLVWLLGRCAAAGVRHVVLPLVDHSSLRGSDEIDELARLLLDGVIAAAQQFKVEIHLETDLPPTRFAELLDRVAVEIVRVNYDSGNSAALDYSVAEEFAAYGQRIGSVHIKDRRRGGPTVPLGTGDADLPALWAALGQVGYEGDLILQVARGISGEELAWARANRELVETAVAAVATS